MQTYMSHKFQMVFKKLWGREKMGPFDLAFSLFCLRDARKGRKEAPAYTNPDWTSENYAARYMGKTNCCMQLSSFMG